MSIERGQAAGGAAAAAPATARGTAGKNGGPAPAGDFLALLLALDTTALDASLPAGPDALVPELAGQAQDETDPALPSGADGTQLPVPVPAGLPSPLGFAPTPPSAASATAADRLVADGLPQALQAQPPPQAPALQAALALPGADAQADAVPPQAAPPLDRPPANLAAPASTAAATVAAATLAAAPGSAYASVLEQMQLKQRLAAQDGAAGAATPAAERSPLQPADVRPDRAAPLLAALVPAAPPADAAATALLQASPTADATKRWSAARSDALGSTTATPQAAADFRPTVQYDSAVAPPTTPPTAPEEALADQISYWAAQGLRGAAFTVHGEADSVQVSIALSGNEARVEFRSEHAATRDWLAASTDQLRELLEREGVVLAGVSVGAQQAGQQPQQRSSQPPSDTASPGAAGRRAAASTAGAAGAAPVAPRAPAGAVDLFV